MKKMIAKIGALLENAMAYKVVVRAEDGTHELADGLTYEAALAKVAEWMGRKVDKDGENGKDQWVSDHGAVIYIDEGGLNAEQDAVWNYISTSWTVNAEEMFWELENQEGWRSFPGAFAKTQANLDRVLDELLAMGFITGKTPSDYWKRHLAGWKKEPKLMKFYYEDFVPAMKRIDGWFEAAQDPLTKDGTIEVYAGNAQGAKKLASQLADVAKRGKATIEAFEHDKVPNWHGLRITM